ncbi:MAG TPA: hypothetical protein VGC40_02705 [Paenirhodobacter sp.]
MARWASAVVVGVTAADSAAAKAEWAAAWVAVDSAAAAWAAAAAADQADSNGRKKISKAPPDAGLCHV